MAKATKVNRSAKIMAWKHAKARMSIDEISDSVQVTITALRSYLNKKFKEECLILWSQRDRTGQCAINDSECSGSTNAHHVLPKGAYPHLCCEDKNRIEICENHHVFHPTMSAHRNMDNFIAMLRLIEWENIDWYDTHRYDRVGERLDFEEIYFRLADE